MNVIIKELTFLYKGVLVMIFYPSKKELMDAIIDVLHTANTTMSTSSIDQAVATKLSLSPEQLSEESANSSGTEYSYRMRWARTELKQKKIITNPKRGEWILLKEA